MLSITGYRNFIEYLKGFCSFHTFSSHTGQPGVILRHDIDLDLDMALQMARVENELEVPATYFIMLTSPAYNPLSRPGRKIIREMADSGAEIGLHFDPSLYDAGSSAEFESFAEHEAQMLAEASGTAITAISLHCPSVNGIYPEFSRFINAYDKQFFSEDLYCSDSCKSFRGKDPRKWAELAESNTIQFLTHPLHYTGDGDSYIDHMLLHLKNHAELVEQEFKVNPVFTDDFAGRPLASFISKGT